MADKKKTKNGKVKGELCYKVETSKIGLFGIKLLSSALVLLLIAAFIAGGFVTTAAGRVLYVIIPYVLMLPPMIIIAVGIAQLWNLKDIIQKKQYDSAVVGIRRACVLDAVFGAVAIVCDFVYVCFVSKEAALKDELMFLLMCALCFIFAVALLAVNRMLKCRPMGQFDAPPPPPPMPPREHMGR